MLSTTLWRVVSSDNDLLSYDNQNDWLSHNNDIFSHNVEIISHTNNKVSNGIVSSMCIKAAEVSGWSKADQNYLTAYLRWIHKSVVQESRNLQAPAEDKQQLQTSGKLRGTYGWMHQKCWMAEIITNRETVHW